jgi:hypothetical protein
MNSLLPQGWEFGREGWAPLIAGFAGLILLVGWIYRRDTSQLRWYWKAWLFGLRASVVAALLIIMLEPQERIETKLTRPSRVELLVDTSVSMGFPEKSPTSSAPANEASVLSRSQAIENLLQKSPLLATLRKTHDVHLSTFDSKLHAQQLLPRLAAGPASPSTKAAGETKETPPNWAEILKPNGLETRLGESLIQLIRESAGESLSGVVVISDGENNAGIESATARETALAAKVRVHTVGVGSTERPINLQLTSVQSPTHVHLGDAFTLTSYVQAQGLAGRAVQVELLSKLEGEEGEPAVIQTREATILEDGTPVAVAFDYLPTEAGRRIFNVRVKPAAGIRELTLADNEKPLPPVEVIERKTKVLILAGGPMRDYQFVRNLLHRDASIELDVWLQTGSVGISQESSNLIFEFPTTREDLFKYDVIMAFDPNWKLIPDDGLKMLSEWVFQQAGGMILVAGDVYTPELAGAHDNLKTIQTLYPVVLSASLFDIEFKNDEFQQAWPIEFSREGSEAEFLQLTDAAQTSAATWKQLAGFYRCYPTSGPKAGATVYAYFSDPRSADESGKPILLASQFYGAGRTLYLGSAEMWRLRAVDESFYDRFWIKALREVGQGRLLRGTNRGVLLLERTTYPLGSTVQVRANILDPQFREYVADRVMLEVYEPSGRPLVPAIALMGDKNRPGQFHGAFSGNLAGRYRLELSVPESRDQVTGYVQIELPNLEYDRPEQDDAQLRRLATTEFGGRYFTLAEALDSLPTHLPDRSVTKTQFDVPRTLWDQPWVLYLLVGLLSAEWLTRKLLKLA